MTVKELIVKLQAMNPDLQVVRGVKYGVVPVENIEEGVCDGYGDWQPPYIGEENQPNCVLLD